MKNGERIVYMGHDDKTECFAALVNIQQEQLEIQRMTWDRFNALLELMDHMLKQALEGNPAPTAGYELVPQDDDMFFMALQRYADEHLDGINGKEAHV